MYNEKSGDFKKSFSYLPYLTCPPGGFSCMDHCVEVHGRPPGTQMPDGHQRRQREDPRHDKDL